MSSACATRVAREAQRQTTAPLAICAISIRRLRRGAHAGARSRRTTGARPLLPARRAQPPHHTRRTCYSRVALHICWRARHRRRLAVHSSALTYATLLIINNTPKFTKFGDITTKNVAKFKLPTSSGRARHRIIQAVESAPLARVITAVPPRAARRPPRARRAGACAAGALSSPPRARAIGAAL